jgi:ketosteroid isomerase-like protein
VTSAEVSALEDRRWEAVLAADVATLTELYSPDIAYTHTNGTVDTREGFLAPIASGLARYTSISRDDLQIRDHGDVVVITGRLVMEIQAQGQQFNKAMGFTAVWARQDDRWQLIAWHATSVEE